MGTKSMIYFIPSWYKKEEWKEKEEAWYIPKRKIELDDTVKQIQLFSRNQLFDYEILLLSYAPNFRRFLHRQSIYRAKYWSVFDSIQCIKSRRIGIFSFRNLTWPSGIEFVYMPFIVLAYLGGSLFAKVEFGDDGNLIYIDMYDGQEIVRRNYYDDRGFVSLTVLYENGKPMYERYLDTKGKWKIEKNLETNHVIVNPNNAFYLSFGEEKAFEKSEYDNLEDLICEVFRSNLRKTTREDIFSVAIDNAHAGLIERLIGGENYLLSFYQDRCDLLDERIDNLIYNSKYIVTDRRTTSNRVLRKKLKNRRNISDITPYDFRQDDSISQEFHEKNILVSIDNIYEYLLTDLVNELLVYVKSNPRVKIHFLTRNGQGSNRIFVSEMLEKLAGEHKEVLEHFVLDVCEDEMAVNRKIKESILLVDLSESADIFMGMNSLSVGIPQLVSKENEFVRNGKNGQVINNVKEIGNWLEYYLTDLSHINEARIESYKIGEVYSTERLKMQWIKIIKEINRAE
jgi:accessory secretory protein Asp1